jgi:hypothetical protein
MVEETAMIAAEQFVGALSVQHHFDTVLTCGAEDVILPPLRPGIAPIVVGDEGRVERPLLAGGVANGWLQFDDQLGGWDFEELEDWDYDEDRGSSADDSLFTVLGSAEGASDDDGGGLVVLREEWRCWQASACGRAVRAGRARLLAAFAGWRELAARCLRPCGRRLLEAGPGPAPGACWTGRGPAGGPAGGSAAAGVGSRRCVDGGVAGGSAGGSWGCGALAVRQGGGAGGAQGGSACAPLGSWARPAGDGEPGVGAAAAAVAALGGRSHSGVAAARDGAAFHLVPVGGAAAAALAARGGFGHGGADAGALVRGGAGLLGSSLCPAAGSVRRPVGV